MTEADRDWAVKEYRALYGMFYAGAAPSHEADLALWKCVADYEADLFVETVEHLRTTWTLPNPPAPVDVRNECRRRREVQEREERENRALGDEFQNRIQAYYDARQVVTDAEDADRLQHQEAFIKRRMGEGATYIEACNDWVQQGIDAFMARKMTG